MADVDTILASQTYTDRKGRTWALTSRLLGAPEWAYDVGDGWFVRTPAQMRTLIVRERHSATCPGLIECYTDHPVPVVLISRGVDGLYFEATNDNEEDTQVCTTLTAALDAARHMTGATP